MSMVLRLNDFAPSSVVKFLPTVRRTYGHSKLGYFNSPNFQGTYVDHQLIGITACMVGLTFSRLLQVLRYAISGEKCYLPFRISQKSQVTGTGDPNPEHGPLKTESSN